MRRLNNWVRERINVLIGTLLTLIGFGSTSCENTWVEKYGVPPDEKYPDDGTIVAMYGVPSASFEIQGSVSDQQTGQALDNIQVQIDDRSTQIMVRTNKDGYYSYRSDIIFPTDSVFVTFTDSTNEYQPTYIAEKMDYDGGDGSWNEGHATITIDALMVKTNKGNAE